MPKNSFARLYHGLLRVSTGDSQHIIFNGLTRGKDYTAQGARAWRLNRSIGLERPQARTWQCSMSEPPAVAGGPIGGRTLSPSFCVLKER
jgi:hypothetical protein